MTDELVRGPIEFRGDSSTGGYEDGEYWATYSADEFFMPANAPSLALQALKGEPMQHHVNEWQRACEESTKRSRERREREPLKKVIFEWAAIVLFCAILAAVVIEALTR